MRRARGLWMATLAGALLALALAAPGQALAGSFRVTFDPPASKYAPQGNPDSPKTAQAITVTALGPDGRPLRDALIDVALTAPRHSALTGSDVPRVEGRRLLSVRLGAPDGRATFRYVMPIRGTYGLSLRATPAPGSRASFAAFGSQRSFTLSERSGELLKLVLFAAGLLAFGAISAFVLVRAQLQRGKVVAAARPVGRAQRRGTLAVSGVLVALAVGFVAFLAANAAKDARSDRRVAALQGPGTGLTRTARSERVALRYHISRSPRDGIGTQTLLGISGAALDARTSQPLRDAVVRIEAIDQESGTPVFVADTTAPDGTFAWEQMLWDGIDYDIAVSAAAPGSGASPAARATAHAALPVEPISPPLDRKLIALGLLLVPLVLGMAGGGALARRRRRPVSRPRHGLGTSSSTAPTRG
ncbi:MAG: hypothetical protein QOI62_3191 [Solirubrobacteraceae bacterium]|jgi:hypothetical protein|nr:hypothetical protein [Solirubrobacteraceae bacterium]MEA2393227.1 hypothetical protein [Solirubrobacteraceae bacterium]